ncbi:unnamed protein product [Notodromas monacha]|uniref:Uncharacterized protein n=1 Tax=Notodromas monacha TaxID=399045 RepID=A0A7R9GDP8_9CRUS|nr:unnamed protein product [Notodromas monacha]CAG0917120.1 unnamed protein product [Notodromas monacha]
MLCLFQRKEAYDRFPVPKDCGGVDYEVICSDLASCLRKNPPPDLSMESSASLKATKKIQNSPYNASAFTKNHVRRVEEALGEFRCNQNESPFKTDQDLLEDEPKLILDATGRVGDEVLAASPGLRHIDLVDNEQSAYEFGKKMGFKQATKLRLNQALKDDTKTGHFKTFLDTFIRR